VIDSIVFIKHLKKLILFIFLGVEKVTSIFFGGGTPSLTQPEVIEVKLLKIEIISKI
jgi:coproporphyrinogen III oxidase-like Fe-S oxidoreductase